MLRLWGRISSINVRKVVWAAQELGLTLQRIDAGANFGLTQEESYLRMNPNGLIPLLEDDALHLWESNVIVRYLCATYGADAAEPLYPVALPARFGAEQWMDWEQTTLSPPGRDAFIQLIRTPAEQRDDALIAHSVARTEPLLALLDRHLADRPFITGDAFSMADIPVGCDVHRWFGLPRTRPSWPNLERWFANVSARGGAVGVLDQTLS